MRNGCLGRWQRPNSSSTPRPPRLRLTPNDRTPGGAEGAPWPRPSSAQVERRGQAGARDRRGQLPTLINPGGALSFRRRTSVGSFHLHKKNKTHELSGGIFTCRTVGAASSWLVVRRSRGLWSRRGCGHGRGRVRAHPTALGPRGCDGSSRSFPPSVDLET